MQCSVSQALATASQDRQSILSPPELALHCHLGSASHGLARRFQREMVPLMAQLAARARRMTRNSADAEDLVQETMTRAFAGFGSYRQETNARAWLYQILDNTFISAYRKRQCRVVEVLGGDLLDWHHDSPATHTGARQRPAEDEALDRLPDPQIKAAMEALPEPFRQVVCYADVYGYRRTEIAAMMNCSRGTVASRLARGRRRLRALLIDPSDGRRHHAGPDPWISA